MWDTATVAGKAADVFTPSAAGFDRAMIYLHGHGQERLSKNVEFTRMFDEQGLAVVSPQGGACWWLDRVCSAFDPKLTPMEFVRTHVVEWIEQHWQIAPPKIAMFGISMGGQGALNIAYRQARKFPVVAAISPAIDFHTLYGRGYLLDEIFPDAESARQETVTLHLHPLNWPRFQFFACDPQDLTWYEGCERLAGKLRSSGILFECDLQTSHGGHTWTYFTRMAEKALPFIRQGLEQV